MCNSSHTGVTFKTRPVVSLRIPPLSTFIDHKRSEADYQDHVKAAKPKCLLCTLDGAAKAEDKLTGQALIEVERMPFDDDFIKQSKDGTTSIMDPSKDFLLLVREIMIRLIFAFNLKPTASQLNGYRQGPRARHEGVLQTFVKGSELSHDQSGLTYSEPTGFRTDLTSLLLVAVLLQDREESHNLHVLRTRVIIISIMHVMIIYIHEYYNVEVMIKTLNATSAKDGKCMGMAPPIHPPRLQYKNIKVLLAGPAP